MARTTREIGAEGRLFVVLAGLSATIAPIIRNDRGLRRRLSTASALTGGPGAAGAPTPAGQALSADMICGTRLSAAETPRDVAGGEPLFVAQIPSVLTPGDAGPVALEIAYAGTIDAIRVFYFRGRGYSFDEFTRAESCGLGGRTVSVFRPSWAMTDFVLKFGLTVDYESGQGTSLFFAPASLPLGVNGIPAQVHGFSVRVLSRTVRPVPVVRLDDTVLQGVDVFLNSLGNLISNHELSHQWGHFFNWQAIAGITRSDRAHALGPHGITDSRAHPAQPAAGAVGRPRIEEAMKLLAASRSIG